MFHDDEWREFIRVLNHRMSSEKRSMTDAEMRQWRDMVGKRFQGEVPQPPDPWAKLPSHREHQWTIQHRVDKELFWTDGGYWEVWGHHTLHRPEREMVERELARVQAEEPEFPGQLVPVEVTYQIGAAAG
jgi:hypothetical protein